ncbi:MAG: FHA domain-containing protein [Bacteroidaceae bacterium]|nr:FHA domain-containing protein [Bacteroidaceae bacterium]
MKCYFCNWDNPVGSTHCVKCGQPLDNGREEAATGRRQEPKTVRQNESNTDTHLKATVREINGERPQQYQTDNLSLCPECGYHLESGICPSCGFKVTDQKVEIKIGKKQVDADGKKTVRPHRKGEKEKNFGLTPISEDTGEPEGEMIQFDNQVVTLNRDNTDPKNTTITSQQQATVTFEDGKWNIVDQSEYHTTFVQAGRKTELRHGDLILLGNQLYRFETPSD